MHQFSYLLHPLRLGMLQEGPADWEDAILGDHFRYLENLVVEGVVLMAGRTLTTDARTFGIVVFRAPTAERAEAVMQGDPAVKQGIMSAELFPFRVVLGSSAV